MVRSALPGRRAQARRTLYTWVGFVVVIVGAGAALWQLDLQRRQLGEQKEVLKGEVERNKKT